MPLAVGLAGTLSTRGQPGPCFISSSLATLSHTRKITVVFARAEQGTFPTSKASRVLK